MTPSIKILKDPSGARRIIAKENDEVIIDAYLAPGVTFGNEGLIKRWGPGVSIEHLRQFVKNVRQHTELNAPPITEIPTHETLPDMERGNDPERGSSDTYPRLGSNAGASVQPE